MSVRWPIYIINSVDKTKFLHSRDSLLFTAVFKNLFFILTKFFFQLNDFFSQVDDFLSPLYKEHLCILEVDAVLGFTSKMWVL